MPQLLHCHQNEEFGKLDIYRFHGMMKRKQDWRTHNFQIKNGFLKYFKSNTVSSYTHPVGSETFSLTWGLLLAHPQLFKTACFTVTAWGQG